MLGGTFSRGGCPIGLDLGGSTVKLLQLRPSGKGWKALAGAWAPLPLEMATDRAGRVDALAGVIRGLVDAGGFQGRRVVSCLPAIALQYKNMRMPQMPAGELRAAVQWEARERLGLEGDSGHVRFLDAGELRLGDEARRELIVMVAPAGVIEEHIEVLLRCGLQPAAIDVVPGALARSMVSRRVEDQDGPAELVLDVGFSCTKVLIHQQGRVVFFKLIDIGGATLDDTLARAIGVQPVEASRMRRGGEPLESAGTEALRGVLSNLAREVGLCLRYYSVTFRGERPVTAWLTGGEAAEPVLLKALAQEAGIRPEMTNHLRGVDLAPVAGAGGNAPVPWCWAIAAGLSMRNLKRRVKTAA